MDVFLLQLILALVMFVITAISGFFPIKLVKALGKRDGQGAKWLSLLSCFSGGVFLATCFLDVIPHINGLYDKFVKETSRDADFPWPQFFTCIGFFLVYLVEEVCLRVFSQRDIHSLHGSPPDSPLELGNSQSRTTLELIFSHASHQILFFSKVMEGSTNYALSSSPGTYLKSITFAVAISFHSLLEGFALGVQNTGNGILALFISLLLHKCIEAFSVGLQVSRGNSEKLKAVISTIFIYSLMTPVGSILGAFLQESHIDMITKDSAVLILESMAAGTFMYVTFIEVLAQEKENEHDSLLQLVAIGIGFGTIALLQFTVGHEGHDHGGHGHAHHHHSEHPSLFQNLLSSTLPPA